jgi:hypothetical protein
LELKTLVIAETIVPHEDKEKLSVYVRQQLEASDVLTELQKDAVLTMVILAPIEASVNKEETGAGGSLRNSAVLALLKHHHDNIHFLLIGYLFVLNYSHVELTLHESHLQLFCQYFLLSESCLHGQVI